MIRSGISMGRGRRQPLEGMEHTIGCKRKIHQAQDEASQALDKLQNLELEDDDVLVVGVGEDDDLLNLDMENPPENTVMIKLEEGGYDFATKEAPGDNGNETGDQCQMKWLRTVGVDEAGQLRCTVGNANAVDNVSTTGKTESVMADTIRGLVNTYNKRRRDVVNEQGIVSTPLHVVKMLVKDHGETLHSEIMTGPKGYHRVELFTGTLRGIGEGVTRRIAAQMAAVDVLEKVQMSGNPVKIPPVALIPGWLTSNGIFTDLFALCKEKELPRVKIIVKPNTDDDGNIDPKRPPWHAECWVGEELVTVGDSENSVFARREAAREMYHLLTNNEYIDSSYAIGKACQSTKALVGAGFRLVMSDQKKKWILQNRVKSDMVMPEDETELEELEDCSIEDLEKDIDNGEMRCFQSMKKSKLKVRVENRGPTIADDQQSNFSASSVSRCVSVEKIDEDSWY